MVRRIATYLWILALAALGTYGILAGRGPVELTSRIGPLPSAASGERFRFAVLGDVHAFRRPLRETLERARADEISFVVQLGDFVDYDDDLEYRSFVDFVRSLRTTVPLFLVRGNHESMAVDGGFSDQFVRYVREPSYSFEYGGCYFGVLDNSAGVIAEGALSLIERELSAFRDRFPTEPAFLLLHMPPDSREFASPDMSRVSSERLLSIAHESHVSAIFCGHVHDYRMYRVQGIPVFVTGCGGGSLRAPSPETHYLQVDVRGDTFNVERIPVGREWKSVAAGRYALAVLVPRYRWYVVSAVAILLAIEVLSLIRRRRATSRRVFAIVPAAGRSRRMGSDKQLLDVGGRPMVLAVLESVAGGDVAGVALVTHRAIDDALPSPLPRGVFVVRNDDPATEMIDSIRMGLRAWRQRDRLEANDGFLICPADQPGISTADVDACIAAFRASSDRIVIAEYAGKRGHPIIFPAEMTEFVESAACDGGLNALPRAHAGRVTAVACASRGVVRDIDTPEDYARGTGGG